MPTYLPYDDGAPAANGGSDKYTPYVDDGTSAPKKEVHTERDTTPQGLALEVLKGGGRGVMGMAKALGEGLAPPPGNIAGVAMGPLTQNPQVAQLNQQVTGAIAPDPQANEWEKLAGFGGEFAGGSLFGGPKPVPGNVTNMPRALLRPNSYLPETMAGAATEQAPSMMGDAAARAASYGLGQAMRYSGVPFARPIARGVVGAVRRLFTPARDVRPSTASREAYGKLAAGTEGMFFADDDQHDK